MSKEKQQIVFGIFSMGNEFLGFTYGMFMTLSKTEGKIYTYSEEQLETVVKNFRYKVENWEHVKRGYFKNTGLPPVDIILRQSLENEKENLDYSGYVLKVFEYNGSFEDIDLNSPIKFWTYD